MNIVEDNSFSEFPKGRKRLHAVQISRQKYNESLYNSTDNSLKGFLKAVRGNGGSIIYRRDVMLADAYREKMLRESLGDFDEKDMISALVYIEKSNGIQVIEGSILSNDVYIKYDKNKDTYSGKINGEKYTQVGFLREIFMQYIDIAKSRSENIEKMKKSKEVSNLTGKTKAKASTIIGN